jgi:phosphatidylserine decarboxylase
VSVAREGWPFIALAAALAAGAVGWTWWRPGAVPVGATVLLVALTAWVVWFFRDPERTGPRGPHLLVAPADGRVLPVVTVDEPAFLHGKAQRVSIFMNVFNVHVNRYPATGTVAFTHYNPGKFLNAAVDKASLENEQMSVGLETPRGRVLVRQIAGLIARRIVTYSRPGDRATQGERFGLIRFGSRVDVFVPPEARVLVRPGDVTVAGETVIAEWP